MPGTERFYAELPAFTDFVEVTNPAHYRPAPDDWLIVITDVIGSTQAIEAGRYKDVNSLGVASIVGLRNAFPEIELPFVFGGDGATILVPGSQRVELESALRGIRAMARRGFDMDMRTSLISVEQVRRAGHEVLVARYQASPDVALAMFSGSGLSHAEREIKNPQTGGAHAVAADGPAVADFTGFECRWRPIPSRNGQVAAILVQARGEADAAIYRTIIEAIEAILEGDGRPVHSTTLHLQDRKGNFETEAKIRAGNGKGMKVALRKLKAKTDAVIGTTLMNKGWSAGGFPGDIYRSQVVANTDFRKFDDTLRMVVDATPEALERIRALLAARHAAGEIVYGLQVSASSLMTCAIEAYEGKHVHFVDGADGGYALAAKQLKRQIKDA